MAVKGRVGQQLPLFEDAVSLRDSLNASFDRRGVESMGDMWSRKVQQSKGTAHPAGPGGGVYEALSKRGFQETIHVDENATTRMIGNGHHRVAAGADIQEKTGRTMWVPTTYGQFKNPMETYPQNYDENWRRGLQ